MTLTVLSRHQHKVPKPFRQTEALQPRSGRSLPHLPQPLVSSRILSVSLNLLNLDTSRGFSSGSAVKNLPAMRKPQETRVQSLSQEDPLGEHMAPIPVFLSGELHGQGSLAGYSDLLNTHAQTLHMHVWLFSLGIILSGLIQAVRILFLFKAEQYSIFKL